ncbi:MAG: capsular polysaccharide export protein, LipB/KpsS family [Candidatus Asgardarchaeia archaeon]
MPRGSLAYSFYEKIPYIHKHLLKHADTKEIKYLFVTPFSNGGLSVCERSQEPIYRIVTSCEKSDKALKKFFDQGFIIKNIFLNNYVRYSPLIQEYAKKHGTKVSVCEHSWFPASQWHLDPVGFSHESLLAKSRLDNVNIDIEKEKEKIKEYKKDLIQHKYSINKPYIVLILQKTQDITIDIGYPDFPGWQRIIDWANSLRIDKEILIIKLRHTLFKLKRLGESYVFPKDSIVIQSKRVNNNILKNANLVIGVNSTMLYEASLIYNKPVLALGSSWFDAHHPEVIKKIKIDDKIERPVVSEEDLNYRAKMFYIMSKMQIPKKFYSIKQPLEFANDFLKKHAQASQIKKIEDWVDV